jgi:hypothetical protein
MKRFIWSAWGGRRVVKVRWPNKHPNVLPNLYDQGDTAPVPEQDYRSTEQKRSSRD